MRDLLLKISNLLLMAEDQVQNIGLIRGKMEICIFLYHSSRETNSNTYDESAGIILDTIMDGLNSHMDLSFSEGLCGIRYGLNYLIGNKFIDADPDELFIDVDNKILAGINEDQIYDLRSNSPLFSSGMYMLDQAGRSNMELYLKSTLGKCRNFCENTYNETFLLDKKTSIYLNSVLYFLISLHKRGYYMKTIESMIEKILVCLLDTVNQEPVLIERALVTASLLSSSNLHTQLSVEFSDRIKKRKEEQENINIDTEIMLQQLLFLNTRIDINMNELHIWLDERINSFIDQDAKTLCHELSIIGLSLIRNSRINSKELIPL